MMYSFSNTEYDWVIIFIIIRVKVQKLFHYQLLNNYSVAFFSTAAFRLQIYPVKIYRVWAFVVGVYENEKSDNSISDN